MRVKLSADGLHAFSLIHAARPFPVPVDQLRGEVSMRARNSACYLVTWDGSEGPQKVHPDFLELLSPWKGELPEER